MSVEYVADTPEVALGDEQRWPLITIGVTTYNAADTVERAIGSALAQTWPVTEIVVVDDGSTDATPARLQQLAERIPSLRIVCLERNRGVAAARNTILAYARGEFVAFFDDDDISEPQRLEKQYRRIRDYEERVGTSLVICHSARRQRWPDGTERIEPTMGCGGNDRPVPSGERVAERILFGRLTPDVFGSCATCSQMARRGVYQHLGGFDEGLRRHEDTDFNVRLALAGGHFVGIEEPLVVQDITPTGDKRVDVERDNYLRWLQKYRSFLEGCGWYGFCVAWAKMKFDYMAGRRLLCAARFGGLALFRPLKTVLRLLWSWPNRRFNRCMRSTYSAYR